MQPTNHGTRYTEHERAAKVTRLCRAKELRTGSSNGSLDGLLRAQARDRIRELLPDVVRDEVANYLGQTFDSKNS